MTELSDDDLNAIANEALSDQAISGFEGADTKPKSKPRTSIKTFIKQSELKADLAFSVNRLDDAMMNQASLFSHYANQAAKAQLQADRMKNELELVEALIDKELRDEAAESGQKITEALLAKQIRLDPRYQQALKNSSEAKMIAQMTKSTTEAFSQRRDMLVQIGKDLREERLGDLKIKQGASRVEQLKEAALSSMKG